MMSHTLLNSMVLQADSKVFSREDLLYVNVATSGATNAGSGSSSVVSSNFIHANYTWEKALRTPDHY